MTRSIDYRSYKMEGHPVTVIEMSGQVDSTKDFESVEEVVMGDDVEHVAVIMEAVEYINSRGCGGFISLHHKVESRGFCMFVVNPVGGVARVMKQVGCFRLLHMAESLDDVVAQLDEKNGSQ